MKELYRNISDMELMKQFENFIISETWKEISRVVRMKIDLCSDKLGDFSKPLDELRVEQGKKSALLEILTLPHDIIKNLYDKNVKEQRRKENG
jgi:hypothetical protein